MPSAYSIVQSGGYMEILSVLYLLIFAASGVCISRLVLAGDRPVKQIWFGFVFGLAMLLWLPVLAAFVIDFTLAAQLIALFVALAAGIACCIVKNRKNASNFVKPARFSLKSEKTLLIAAVPLVLIGWTLIINHTIVGASDGSLHAGQSTFGDLCMHLGFISSISVQQEFPPDYSILPGTPLGYPFLCDSVSSTFYTLGSSLRFAAILPALYAYLIVVVGVFFFFEQWMKRGSTAVLATYMFFIGGGFGFAYIFNNTKLLEAEGIDRWHEMLYGFYQTPTNLPAEGLRWVNVIADMLVPQRATLFGWALLFPCLQLLYRAAIERETRLFIPLGVLAGCLPLVHTHSFLAIGIISAFIIIAQTVSQLANPKEGGWKHIAYFLLFGAIAVCLAAPQLFGFTFKQSAGEQFVRPYWNWCNESDGWLWFYIKNMGLIFILMLPAFLSTKKDNKIFYGGALLIWLICELVVFQPNPYDNNKLLFIWFAMTCGIVAEYLLSLYDRLVDSGARMKRLIPLGKRVAQRILCVIVIIPIFLSGALTLVREYISADHLGIITNENGSITIGIDESGYELVPDYMVELAEFVKENTARDAVFLTHNNHNNAIAMLTGRSIFCGTGTFLHFHGLDYETRQEALKGLYENPSANLRKYMDEYGISYALVSPYELAAYSVNLQYFEDNFECVYRVGNVMLFKLI